MESILTNIYLQQLKNEPCYDISFLALSLYFFETKISYSFLRLR